MRWRISLVVSLALIVAVSCDQQPAAPDLEAASELESAPNFQATSTWTHSSFSYSVFLYVECLGEFVNFFGEVAYTSHEVTTPSGNTSYTFRFPPTNIPFFAVGQTSGKVYEVHNGLPYNESGHFAAGEVFRLVQHEVYVAENRDKLYADSFLHMTINANGELTADRLSAIPYRCERK